jgi:purine-binding chemotaxis protein CheW
VSESQTDIEQDSYMEFLCFKVSDEVYGIDIMDIKELIKPREVTEVPRAPSFVSGVISLRGVIIPIIDMLDRLGLARETDTGRERVIVVKQGESFCGLLVDEIIQVVRVVRNDIEAAPTVLEGIDRDFVTGIGRAAGRMIILLNLGNIINIHLN